VYAQRLVAEVLDLGGAKSDFRELLGVEEILAGELGIEVVLRIRVIGLDRARVDRRSQLRRREVARIELQLRVEATKPRRVMRETHVAEAEDERGVRVVHLVFARRNICGECGRPGRLTCRLGGFGRRRGVRGADAAGAGSFCACGGASFCVQPASAARTSNSTKRFIVSLQIEGSFLIH
jgi:hypothetical protein